MADILLVNCCLPPRDLRLLAPPQGLLAIARPIKAAGYTPRLLNLASAIPPTEYSSVTIFKTLLGQHEPVLALSVWDSVLPAVVAATRRLKEVRPEVKIILGGPAASTVGHLAIAVFPWLGGIVAGEGETGVVPVLDLLFGRTHDTGQLPSGTYVRVSGCVVAGQAPRPRLADGDIPAPDYSILDDTRYGRAEISMSRGCRYSCKFCSVNSAWGKGVTAKSSEQVRAEITGLWENPALPAWIVHILDDTFLESWSRVEAFCRWHADHRNGRMFTCYARLDELDEARLDFLSAAGCFGVYVGLESSRVKGSGSLSPAATLEKVGMIAQRMNVMTSLIWGDPEEKRDDLAETMTHVERLLHISSRVAVNIYQLAPLSGTYYAQRHRSEAFDAELVPELVYPAYLPALDEDVEAVELIRGNSEIFPAYYSVRTTDLAWKRRFVYNRVAEMQARL